MNPKKYQVFISSTYTDLINARDQITQSILSFYHFPVGMEMFSAGDSDQWTVIQSTIDSSDYYVLILGHRYGSVTEEGISYTEKEYDYAKSKGIPILAFIMDRDAPTKPNERENDLELQNKLNRFVEKAKGNKMCDFWKTPDELASKVIIALSKAFVTHPRIGWIRSDQTTSPKVTEELAKLSKENRELKDELNALQRKKENKKPILAVNINDGILELEYETDPKFDLLELPQKIKMENIPDDLKSFIIERDLVGYNELVSNEIQKVTRYNDALIKNETIKLFGLEIDVSIFNSGKIRATNIYIDLKFPESVTIIEGSKKDFTLPLEPLLIVSPLEKAEKDYEHHIGLQRNPRDIKLSGLIETERKIITRNIQNENKSIDQNLTSWLKDNTITFKCEELLHTRMKHSLDNYVIIPKEEGNYDIEVSIICEEYSELEKMTIPLVIKEIKKQEI